MLDVCIVNRNDRFMPFLCLSLRHCWSCFTGLVVGFQLFSRKIDAKRTETGQKRKLHGTGNAKIAAEDLLVTTVHLERFQQHMHRWQEIRE